MSEALIATISGIIILAGLVGTILPFLPGAPLALGGLILYGWFTNFTHVTVLGILVFSFLTALTIIFDFLAPALGAKGYKSSRAGVWGAMIGGAVGIFTMGPLGAIFGPFLGGFIGEYLVNPSHEHALKAAWGAFVGMMIGTLFKLIVTISMFGYFLYAIIRSL